MNYCRFAVLIVAMLLVKAFGQQAPTRDDRSLGEIARAVREKKSAEVQVTTADSKELFAAMGDILRFVSAETGFEEHTAVKHELVGREKAGKAFADLAGDSAEKERLLRSELVLKKFGLLPPDYSLQRYFEHDAIRDLGGYYNSKDKTLYLVNWVPLAEQRPVMAHELTHALQDQNYDLLRLMTTATAAENRPPRLQVDVADNEEFSAARRAMVEGQAMLVYMDYLIKGLGVRVTDSTNMMNAVLGSLRSYDAPVVLHDAPRVLKETAYFPYEEGLAFIMEVLQKGGRNRAFAGVFARPPRSSHEILQPPAYLNREKSPVVTIPDLSGKLPQGFEPYEAGSMGELDVRIMAREFGRENDIFTVAQQWNGGAYLVVKRVGADPVRTADLAVVYVSRWKTLEAAKRFTQIYEKSLPKRVKVLKEELLLAKCPEDSTHCKLPIWASRVMTDEGPTYLEIWPGNTVLITHSFDESTVAQLRPAVLFGDTRSGMAPDRELSSSLLECRTFAALQEQAGRQIARALSQPK